jgi:hypothetical protein
MAAEIQDYEPEKLTAGVTWKWSKSLSDYPASDWSLSYYLRRNGATETSFGSTADGDTFQVNVGATVTALFTPDVYDIVGIVTKGSEKFVVYDGILKVLTNPASSSAYDPRSHARRVLDLIEAAMEGRIPNGMESYTIGGRSINKIPLKELRELYEKYKQDVEREVQIERLANGRRSGKNIGIRFVAPTGVNAVGYSYQG